MKPLDFGEILGIVERKDIGDFAKAYEIEKAIKQRLKKACEFYLKYRNSPQKLWSDGKLDNGKKNELISKFLAPIDNGAYGVSKRKILDKYNEWLFKLTFKSVLGGEDV